jgi:hypothetical protein
MFYSLLGRVVWFAGKRLLRHRYGRTYLPKPLLAGGVVATAIGIALAAHHGESRFWPHG